MSLFGTRRNVTAGLALTVAAFGTASPQAPSSADRYVGNWGGTLALPSAQLRLALTVTRESDGTFAGYMTSIDQGNAKIPARITLNGDTLVVAMEMVHASYTAVVSVGKDSLHGSFTQGMVLPLDMVRAAPPPAMSHPQEPKAPFPYAAQDVSFESAAGVRLAGTVLLPPGKGPFPAVVLVTGSGPQDRNEELLGHKPFLVIADFLARHGIASLRYDDRGVGKSTGNFRGGTSADFADDAEAAVHFLRVQAGIARERVGIMGHSEGGLIAPMVAARSREVAFIVLLAGPGIPGDSILLLQQALISAASGVPPAQIKRAGDANAQLFAAIRAARDSTDAAARIAEVSRRLVTTFPEAEQDLASKQLHELGNQLNYPWMRYFIAYDPRVALQKVHVPVLALGGTLDLQVPYKENLSAIDTALKAAGNHDYRTVSLPRLNHLFQTSTTGNPAEYATISETFSPEALALVEEWINTRFAAHGKR